MSSLLLSQQKYLDAFVKTAQYLAGVTAQQDVWGELTKLLTNFFRADLAGFAEPGPDGQIMWHNWSSTDRVGSQQILMEELLEAVEDVRLSGFLACKLVHAPQPASVALLPIIEENRTRAVMLVGHAITEPLPRELLNVYLALAGLASTTIRRWSSEIELKQHRQHLEKLVKVRTLELTASNRELEREVLERKQSEQALVVERKRLYAVLDLLPGFVYLCARDYSIPFANKKFIELFGEPEDRRCYEIIHDRKEPCIKCPNMDLLRTGKPQIREWTDAKERTFLLHHYLFPESSKNPLLLEVGMDITPLKLAQTGLQEEKERLRVTLKSIGDGVITTDIEGRVTLINPVAENLTGWQDDEARGLPVDKVFYIINEKTRQVCENPIQKVLATNMIVGLANDTVLVARDGTERIIADSGAPIIDINGRTTGVVLVFRDISERIRLEADLRHARKMEAIGTLAGGIAHNFNNMLGIILGNAELAEQDIPDSNPVKENLKEIRSASLRARDIVRQLLTFSRKTKEDRLPMNLALVVKEAIKFLQSALPANIEFRENLSGHCHIVVADPNQVHNIMIHLGTNAAHAMEETGGVLECTLQNVSLAETNYAADRKLKPGDYVLLTVKDSGSGIPADNLDRIFDPFFTTKDVGTGTGMGLAVVHGIVEDHGGFIRVESRVGEGTTFQIYFPAAESKASVKTETTGELPTGTERILFVEDEVSLARLSGMRLERLGYQVKVETDPRMALKLFTENPHRFDLIVTDMSMPGMNGDQLIVEVLSIRSDMPVILCTGYSEKVDQERAHEMGASSYLEKPIDGAHLAITVRKVLDQG